LLRLDKPFTFRAHPSLDPAIRRKLGEYAIPLSVARAFQQEKSFFCRAAVVGALPLVSNFNSGEQ
jgi:hypothetical protein